MERPEKDDMARGGHGLAVIAVAACLWMAGCGCGCTKVEPETSKGPAKQMARSKGRSSPRSAAASSMEARAVARSSAPDGGENGPGEKKLGRAEARGGRGVGSKEDGGKPASTKRAARSSRVSPPSDARAKKLYPWPRRREGYEPLSERLATPSGYTRVEVAKGSYQYWLRHLPLLPAGTKVRDYRGEVLSGSTSASSAVVDLDVGKRDLQQCIDTILRLRAEYLWWAGRRSKIKFRYAGGRYFGWAHWKKGLLPKRRRRRTVFVQRSARSSSRKSFRRYLTYMFAMTGTMHHVKAPRVKPKDLRAGDFFVHPPPRSGALGHAVVILDVARSESGSRVALIGEGYTPAQDLHVLRTPSGGVWYELDPARPVQTPQWPAPFRWKDLARFKH